jgi:hypothetical protein
VFSSIRAGIRYARHAPALRAVLVRTTLFVPFASALWALLPVLARHEMGLDSVGYGILFGCLGAGAVAGAIILPEIQRRFSKDSLAVGATILFAAATVALAEIRYFGWLCLVMLAGGAAWITLMASFNIATQSAAPSWVRARALALYLLIFQGSMATGSAVWGAVTERAGISTALVWAAAGLFVGLAAVKRYPLKGAEELNLTPSAHWPEPTVVVKPHPEDGPVLVTVEYHIDPHHSQEFCRRHAGGTAATFTRRRVSLGFVPRPVGARPLPGNFRRRVLGRASAPAPTRNRQRSGRRRARPRIPHWRGAAGDVSFHLRTHARGAGCRRNGPAMSGKRKRLICIGERRAMVRRGRAIIQQSKASPTKGKRLFLETH